jgi:NAD-dependent SIR2 family protein deacetylase
VTALTGAGCSTESGIPDYRDGAGNWKRPQPVTFQEFVRSESMRRRYWARSFVGWPQIAEAAPNPAHHALATLERSGHVQSLITQNVDGLHQKAGSREVIDLHGRIDQVICLACGPETTRSELQKRLGELNPGWQARASRFAPDGDADLGPADLAAFQVAACPRCRGILKPDVVFFGEGVPCRRVEQAFACVRQARALLIAGSSLMVWSGFRFVKEAAGMGIPVAAVNLGRTRADEAFDFKIAAPCGETLTAATQLLGLEPVGSPRFAPETS